MKTFKDYFDKIYCLSFVEAQNRRDYIKKQLTELNLFDGVEFNYGMPFGKIRAMKKHFNEMVEESYIATNNNIAAIGCSFNHYSAIKSAYESGANTVLLFEDDALFLKNRDTIIEYLDNMPAEWDYIYFTPTFVKYYSSHDMDILRTTTEKYVDLKQLETGIPHWNTDYNRTTCWMSSCAYALNRKAMSIYISIFENSHRIVKSDFIEYFFHNISQSPLKAYTTNIRLFAQPAEMNTLSYDEECGQYRINNANDMVSTSINVTTSNFFEPDPTIKSLIN